MISLFKVTKAGAVSAQIARRNRSRYLFTPGIVQATSTAKKKSRILKHATPNPVRNNVPIRTGPSRLPVKETRTLPGLTVLAPVLHAIPVGGRICPKPYKGIVVKPRLLEYKKATKAEDQVKTESPDKKPLPQRAGLDQKGKKGNSNRRDFVGYRERGYLRKLYRRNGEACLHRERPLYGPRLSGSAIPAKSSSFLPMETVGIQRHSVRRSRQGEALIEPAADESAFVGFRCHPVSR